MVEGPRLSRGMERRLREVERAKGVLARVDARLLADLQRRREVSAQPDGFGSGNPGSGGDSTSTEAAALSGLPGADDPERDDWRYHARPDFIGESVERALDHLDVATKALRDFDRDINPVIHAADALKERKSSIGECKACGRDVPGTPNDRLKSGYCTSVKGIEGSGCYEKWIANGRPDRPRFERETQGRRTGYKVDEIDALVATGTLPAGRMVRP